jgi:hypothetical protein
MSFGKNPFVAKAQLAEQKAEAAGDRAAREMAYRDAAHQWDRAAAREKPGKFRDQYEENATRTRELADAGDADVGAGFKPAQQAAPPPKLTIVK